MEKKLPPFSKHVSTPVFPEEDDNSSGSIFAAATHPSVLSRNKDDLFRRIRSGNDVLSRLPDRFDPNIQFSDDDEDEEVPQNKENENKSSRFKAPNLDKTPELRPASSVYTLPTHKFQQSFSQRNFTPRGSHFHRHPFSATKPPNSASNFPQKAVPQSEQKPRATDNFHQADLKKTPGKHPQPSVHKFRHNFTPRGGQFQNHPFSASKPPPSSARKPLPQSEQTPRKSENAHGSNQAHSVQKSKSKLNLMTQPEFKVPLPTQRERPSTNDAIVVNGKPYSVLSLLGSGGSCKVFSVFDDQKNLVAVKCVDLKGTDPLIRKGYEKEIEYLRKLQGSNRVIRMFDFEYRENELFLVLERGEIDFGKYIAKQSKLKQLTPLTIKFFWSQMLEAVSDIHKYGIVHSDLKPANFLLVAGNLKLIDFGIATSVPEDKTSTFRDTQVGTLNYMSPEAVTQLNGDADKFKVGVKSDVWSLGCILYTLVYGMTPFQNLKTLWQKISAITSPNYHIEFKPYPDRLVVDVLKRCLKRDPKERASVEELLRHPYLKEEASSPESAQSKDLSSVMAQMQVLTPKRMSYLTQVVRDLSQKHN